MTSDPYELVAELYDHVGPYRTRPDVDFFLDAARDSGGPVLEVGCGTGRVLIPTARAGVEITGLDASDHMLEVCRASLRHEPDEVRSRATLVRADMRSFELDQSFRLVTLPFRPFQQLVSVDDQIACLETIHRHLDGGGRLILDLFNPSLPALVRDNVGEERGAEPPFTLADGRKVLRRERVVSRDYAAQVIGVELIYYVTHPEGREERIVHAFPMRYLFRFEVEHLLARCGFEVEAVFSDYERQPFGSTYPGELIVVSRKAHG